MSGAGEGLLTRVDATLPRLLMLPACFWLAALIPRVFVWREDRETT